MELPQTTSRSRSPDPLSDGDGAKKRAKLADDNVIYKPEPTRASDLTIVGQDGKSLRLHALTLQQNSKVFLAMENLGSADNDKLALPYDSAMLKAFFLNMYGGQYLSEAELSEANVLVLLKLAHEYDVPLVHYLCHNFLSGLQFVDDFSFVPAVVEAAQGFPCCEEMHRSFLKVLGGAIPANFDLFPESLCSKFSVKTFCLLLQQMCPPRQAPLPPLQGRACFQFVGSDGAIRASPEYEGERTEFSMTPYEMFWASESIVEDHIHTDNNIYPITFFRLDDGRGWIHNFSTKRPGVATVIQMDQRFQPGMFPRYLGPYNSR